MNKEGQKSLKEKHYLDLLGIAKNQRDLEKEKRIEAYLTLCSFCIKYKNWL